MQPPTGTMVDSHTTIIELLSLSGSRSNRKTADASTVPRRGRGKRGRSACLPTFDLVVQSDHCLWNPFSFGPVQDSAGDGEPHDVEHGL